jgi:hypothetical protein
MSSQAFTREGDRVILLVGSRHRDRLSQKLETHADVDERLREFAKTALQIGKLCATTLMHR